MPRLLEAPLESAARDLCVKCLRAKSVCLCAGIQSFAPFFQTVLLQHPKERKNTIGTARFTHLHLSNSKLITGFGFDQDKSVNRILDAKENYCVVLFPGPQSINVSEARERFMESIPKNETGAPKNLVIFVIDGTWAHARGMLRQSTRIAALPKVSFNIDLTSQYKVRKQPKAFCLSTVEAVAKLIHLLDPKLPSDELIKTFARMVDQQVECAERELLRFPKYQYPRVKDAIQ